MATRVLSGQYLNHLSRVASGNIVVSSSSSLYPAANLFDGRPSRQHKGASAVADLTTTVDLNLTVNGGMETNNGGNVATWVEANTGSGDVTRTTSAGEFNSGVAGMKLAAGTGTATAYQDITVRAGERVNFTGALLSDGTTTAKIQVFIRDTAQYVTSAGALQSGSANIYSRTANTWATSAQVSFTVPGYTTVRADTVTLRVTVVNDTSTKTVFADDIYIWPSWDFMSIHGHNIPSVIAVQLRSSTDNFSASDTLEATSTVYRGRFYSLLAAVNDRRYVRVKYSGTPLVAIQTGELVIGQTVTLSENARHPGVSPWEIVWDYPQTRNSTIVAEIWAYPLVQDSVATLKLPFLNTSSTYYEEIRDEVMRRSRFGVDPIVLIPWDSEALVIHGRVDRSWSTRRVFDQFGGNYEHDLFVAESPFWVETT